MKNIFTAITRKKKIFFPLFLVALVFLLLGNFFIFSQDKEKVNEKEEEVVKTEIYPKYVGDSENNPSLELRAAISVFYDGEKEKTLYRENAGEVLSIASISKLMTALIALENYNLEDPVGVTEYDVTSRTEFRDFRAWSETPINEVIHPLIIESNNSSAFSLALISNRYLPGEKDPVENFVNRMNSRAEQIGMENSVFINPSGLDGAENYNRSTAEDLALLSRYLLDNRPEIFDISRIPYYRVHSPDGLIYYEVINTNVFLLDDVWGEKIAGGKTGWTRTARGCLVLVLFSPGKEGYIINVVLGAEDRFGEMAKLVDYIYENYRF